MAFFEELEHQTEALHGRDIKKFYETWKRGIRSNNIFMWYIIILTSFKAKQMKNLFA